MPPKKCSDTAPPEQRDTPNNCLKKGVYVGMNSPKKLTADLNKDIMRDIARLNQVRNYSRMSKTELYNALVAKGVKQYYPFQLGH